ncbi:reverse transcriptase domain-containing protein [Tanacetum coccineum]
MGMVVSTIHGAVKFYTTQGIRTVFSTHESDKIREGVKKIRETSPTNTEGVLNCTDAKEKIVVNNKYPEQTVTCQNTSRKGVTYQRLVDKVFNEQTGRNLEAYINDMIIKSTSEEDMLTDIKELFSKVSDRSKNMKALRSDFPIELLRRAQSPIHGEVLMMYLAASTKSISTALFARIEEGQEGSRKKDGHKARRNKTSSSDGSGAGLMLKDPKGKKYTYALRFEFKTTNNEAEYEALLAGLRIAQEMEIVNLAIFVDSQLLVNQIKGTYTAKQPAIKEYLQRTKETLRGFRSYTIKHIRRNQNKKADALSKLASMTFEHLTKEVLVEVLARRSIEEKEVLQVETKDEESWMTPIHEYLLSGLLPEDLKESRKSRIKAPQYKLIRGSLYKKSFYTSWLRCIAPPKTDDVIKEIHEGSCGSIWSLVQWWSGLQSKDIIGCQCIETLQE